MELKEIAVALGQGLSYGLALFLYRAALHYFENRRTTPTQPTQPSDLARVYRQQAIEYRRKWLACQQKIEAN